MSEPDFEDINYSSGNNNTHVESEDDAYHHNEKSEQTMLNTSLIVKEIRNLCCQRTPKRSNLRKVADTIQSLHANNVLKSLHKKFKLKGMRHRSIQQKSPFNPIHVIKSLKASSAGRDIRITMRFIKDFKIIHHILHVKFVGNSLEEEEDVVLINTC